MSRLRPVSGTINIAESKSGKPRRVYLTDDGKAAFESWTAGRGESEVIFKDRFGNPWGSHGPAPAHVSGLRSSENRACDRHAHAAAFLRLLPGASRREFGHRRRGAWALRHAHGQQHYGHLAPSHIADAIRAHLPALGIKIDSTITRAPAVNDFQASTHAQFRPANTPG